MSNIGRLLKGRCNGYFGSHSYEDKRVEAEGVDWVVARDTNGTPEIAIFDSEDKKNKLLREWEKEGEYL